MKIVGCDLLIDSRGRSWWKWGSYVQRWTERSTSEWGSLLSTCPASIVVKAQILHFSFHDTQHIKESCARITWNAWRVQP